MATSSSQGKGGEGQHGADGNGSKESHTALELENYLWNKAPQEVAEVHHLLRSVIKLFKLGRFVEMVRFWRCASLDC